MNRGGAGVGVGGYFIQHFAWIKGEGEACPRIYTLSISHASVYYRKKVSPLQQKILYETLNSISHTFGFTGIRLTSSRSWMNIN